MTVAIIDNRGFKPVIIGAGAQVAGVLAKLASTSAMAAALAATQAQGYAVDASDFADLAEIAALTLDNVYASTADGLGGVGEGGYFWTANPLKLWRDVAGVAVEQDAPATRAALLANDGADLITFLMAGDGAVAISIRNALRDRISATFYGTVGDGDADDLDSIQAALDYAGSLVANDTTVPSLGDAHKGGKLVSLAAGTYNTSSGTLEIPYGVKLCGEGSAATVIKSSFAGHIVRNKAEAFADGTYDKYGVGLCDLCIVGDRDVAGQVNLGILRCTSGDFRNLLIVKGGGMGMEVRQCLHSMFMNIECNQNVGHALEIGAGFNLWGDATNNLPSNANTFYNFHAAANDGAGLKIPGGANGNRFFNTTLEYNYAAAGDNEGYQLEITGPSETPNSFFGLWTEGPCEAFVYMNAAGANANIWDWDHYSNGPTGWTDRALILVAGSIYIERPVGQADSYKEISGSIAPFRIADKTSSFLTLINPTGANVTGMGNVEGPDYTTDGLDANLVMDGRFGVYGVRKYYFDSAQGSMAEWWAEGDAHPFLRLNPNGRRSEYGNGTTSPANVVSGDATTLYLTANGGFIALQGGRIFIPVIDVYADNAAAAAAGVSVGVVYEHADGTLRRRKA